MVLVCCVCNRVKKQERWVEDPFPTAELASHGYCPECAAAARVELALFRLKNLQKTLAAWPASSVA